MPQYDQYQTEDFVLDQRFRQWITQPDADNNAFWSAFLEEHPYKKEAVAQARLILLALQVKERDVTDARQATAWNDLLTKLATASVQKDTVPYAMLGNARLGRQKWLAIAAAITILLMSVGIWWRLGRPMQTQYQTEYGEIQTLTLPDHSRVTLNANSRLTIHGDWSEGKPREVWLEGEAHFQVRKKPGSARTRFVVHTTDLNVEVLGTCFTVKKRADGTRVVLNSGKIKLDLTGGNPGKPLLMQPGELVEFSQAQRQLTRKQVVPERYSSWKQRKLMLDNTSVGEVARAMQEMYGVEVHFEDPQLASVVLNGTSLPIDNAESLLNALSTALEVKIVRDGNKVTLKKQ